MLNEKSGNKKKKKGQLNKWLNQTERAEANIKPPRGCDGKSVLLLQVQTEMSVQKAFKHDERRVNKDTVAVIWCILRDSCTDL